MCNAECAVHQSTNRINWPEAAQTSDHSFTLSGVQYCGVKPQAAIRESNVPKPVDFARRFSGGPGHQVDSELGLS
jgi:hypothetical protein